MMLFTCHPQDWGGQLATVFNPRQPIPASRRHYVCRALAYDWQANIPDGFVVRRMDDGLLTQPGLKIPDEVRETLDKWRAMDNPRLQDFGFVAIHQGGADGAEIASWATVDAVFDGVGDAGLFTVETYRRRGLAAVTAAAAVAHGLSHGLSAVSWTCAESNVGSIRTAERLGFEWESDYTLYYFAFDEAQHLGNLAYSLLQNARYQEATGLFERVLALDDTPFWVYYDAACAWAALGDRDRAFEHLNAAIDSGWTDIDSVRECKEFQGLHGMPAWEAVLGRLQRVK
jgi:RimJ/RimL family protein N-acetyltransferase